MALGGDELMLYCFFCLGKPTVTSGFPVQWANGADLWWFFGVSMDMLMSKQLSGQWDEMPCCSCNFTLMVQQHICIHTKSAMYTRNIHWGKLKGNSSKNTCIPQEILFSFQFLHYSWCVPFYISRVIAKYIQKHSCHSFSMSFWGVDFQCKKNWITKHLGNKLWNVHWFSSHFRNL